VRLPVGRGTVMVLASAASFGTLPILVKYAYAAGLTPLQVLSYRFLLAAAGLHALGLVQGQSPGRLGLRRTTQFVLLGGIGYAAQSGAFFGALCCLPASLVELIAYVYPALVTLGAWLFFRRPVGGRRALALAISFGGVSLLIGGIRLQAGLPLLLAIASPVFYAAYILVSERLMQGSPALTASAMVHTGAGVSLFALLVLTGGPALPANLSAWPVLVLLALVPSMIAISFLLAGLPLIGAPQAALISTIEPVVTLTLAAVLLGDRLTPAQLLGAAAVIVAVAVIHLPARAREVPD
jgi:drug/metabolite transporter (DMT)-like permease